jgi:CDP-diacylglycerol--glycerol-3-phosphate 3-phosphatidyltransferase
LRRVDVDTFFWPVIQAGVLGIKEEEKGLGRVWDAVNQSFTPASITDGTGAEVSSKSEGDQVSMSDRSQKEKDQESDTNKVAKGVQVDLTSGYFGLYDAYKRMVIESPAPVRVIAASPKVSLSSDRLMSSPDIRSGKRILRFQRSI